MRTPSRAGVLKWRGSFGRGRSEGRRVDLKSWWGASIVLLAFVCFLVTGLAGLDFGFHWDEPLQLTLVNTTVSTGSFLPHDFYNYPSMTYWLSLLAVFPKVVDASKVTADDFYLNARAVFLVATSLGGIWLYLSLRRPAGELGAAFGGATYLLSYQLAYHARWIAPDAVMASATALFLWLLVVAWESPSTWHTTLPAIAAGIATATKYQGAILLVPVALIFVRRWRAEPSTLTRQLRGLLLSAAAFVTTFLVLTPGAILENHEFFADIRHENDHYRTTHGLFKGVTPYDLHDHVRYFWRLVRYVVLSLPSHIPVLSLLVFALAVVGLVTLLRRDLWFAVVVTLPGLLAALYFSTLTVFVVRNFLFLFPFLAFLAGIGVAKLAERARAKVACIVLVAGLSVVMIVNGAWLVHASRTIADTSPAALVHDTESFIRNRSSQRFVLSKALRATFVASGEAVPDNVKTAGPADYIAVLYSQIRNGKLTLKEWPATSDGTYRVAGPLEVDFDFYPTWAGRDRVLFFTPEEARRFGLTRAELRIGR